MVCSVLGGSHPGSLLLGSHLPEMPCNFFLYIPAVIYHELKDAPWRPCVSVVLALRNQVSNNVTSAYGHASQPVGLEVGLLPLRSLTKVYSDLIHKPGIRPDEAYTLTDCISLSSQNNVHCYGGTLLIEPNCCSTRGRKADPVPPTQLGEPICVEPS